MTTFDRRSNRFLRPKRDRITPLDQYRTRLRSLTVPAMIIQQAYLSSKTAVKQRRRTGMSR